MPDVYDLYMRGRDLLRRGDAHAAATLLERAVSAEPEKGSLREELGRAYFAAGRFRAAFQQFDRALTISPANHYAHFGAGLSLGKLGRLDEAIGHLRLATAMRPDLEDYASALERQLFKQRLHRSRGD